MPSGRADCVLKDLDTLFRVGVAGGLTDGQLLERFLNERDDAREAAFRALIHRHAPMVFRVCRYLLADWHEAEDASQATFIVLAKKARSIRKRDSIASWLFGVAHRMAAQGKAKAARRHRREQRYAERNAANLTEQDGRIDWLELHEQINRLPEHLRAPLILCFLNGHSQREAAAELGCPVRTLQNRLARGQEQLRSRFTRLGLSPSLGFWRATVGGRAISEPIPTGWFETTVRAALQTFNCGTAATTVSAPVATLTGRMLTMMFRAKLRLLVAAVFSAGVMTFGIGTLVHRTDGAPAGKPTPGEVANATPRGSRKDDALPRITLAQQTAPSSAPQPRAQTTKTAEPTAVEGTVVDSEGRPLAEVPVFLSVSWKREPDGSVLTVGRATTDKNGRFRMPAPPLSAFKVYALGTLWAFKAGLALGAVDYHASVDYGPVQIRLLQPAARSVTLKRRDGSPVAGLKVAPRSTTVRSSRGGARGAEIPDELAELLARVSDANGQVRFSSFEPDELPSSVRVWSAAGASQVLHPALPFDRHAERIDLVIEPAGALAGRVVRSDGKSPAGVVINVESARTAASIGAPIRFKEGPIRVNADGRFQTPPVLLEGWRYRVSIQVEGQGSVVSPWIEPAGEGKTATLADLALNSLTDITGRVVDRQARPIAGALVLQSGDGPERTTTQTDANGRFRLGGYAAARGLVVARAEGFRCGGRVVSPYGNLIVLTRLTEAPTRSLSLLPPPLPAAELRVLARRVLDPYLQRSLKEGPAFSAARPLEVLAILDPAAAIETLPELKLGAFEGRLRAKIAAELARTDLQEGTDVAEAAPEPSDRARALVAIVDSLPSEQKASRLELLSKAAVHARASKNHDEALWCLGEVGERMVEQGEVEKAKPIFKEGTTLARTLIDTRNCRLFTGRLATVDLAGALALIEKMSDPSGRYSPLANAAIRLASRQPAECEQLLRRIDVEQRATPTEVACHHMAPVDPDRARRLVDEQTDAFWRGIVRLGFAHGLAKTSRTEAEKAFREALAEMDTRARDLHSACMSLLLSVPFVEGIDPALVPEFLWYALSLRLPAGANGAEAPEVWHSNQTQATTIVARYDRALAAALWSPLAEQAQSSAQDDPRPYRYEFVIAEAQLNPVAAVERVESTPRAARTREYGQNDSRLILSSLLAHWAQGRPQPPLPYVIGAVETFERRDLP
jgi:RNA polymerase sigma factor (sigma-70 family)